MHYRRNADTQLRQLERALEAAPSDRGLLLQVDTARKRAGMIPHPIRRIDVALERIGEFNYQGFMLLKDIQPHLEEAFERSHEVRINAEEFNNRQYLPEIETVLNLRHVAMEEAMSPIRRLKPSRQWIAYASRQGLPLPTTDNERLEVADSVRRKADDTCRELLNSLSRTGVLNAYNFLEAFVDREDELADFLLRVEQVLDNYDLAHEEFLLAKLGEEATPGYITAIGNNFWWQHLS